MKTKEQIKKQYRRIVVAAYNANAAGQITTARRCYFIALANALAAPRLHDYPRRASFAEAQAYARKYTFWND